MPRKKQEPEGGPKPAGATGEGGGAKRHALPVLDGDPVDWPAAVLTTLVRVHAHLERHMAEAVGAHGLTLAQFDVLATLGCGEGITQQELAERLLVTKGNVVGLIDRVCLAGWVERRADPADRRANRLHLTDAGRTRLGEVGPDLAELRSALLGALTGDELRQTHRLLRRLEESVGG